MSLKIKAGNYCYRRRVRSFMREDEDAWIDEMKTHFSQVCEFPASESQVNAWRDTFRNLKESLISLPNYYGDLMLVFEYCLPKKYRGIFVLKRSDVTIVSRDTVVILEFKQTSHFEIGASRQVRGYRRLFRQYHDKSKGKRIKCITVFTDKENYRKDEYRVIRCSPDRLSEIMIEFLGQNPQHLTRVEEKEWLHSSFSSIPDNHSSEE